MNDKVNKIYDQYLKRDFVFGDDNLNPKREISYEKKINLIERFDEIEKEVVARVEELINDNAFIDNSGPELEKLRMRGKSASLKAPELKDILGGMFPEVLNGANPNLTKLLNSLIPLASNDDMPNNPAVADTICGTGFTYKYLSEVEVEDADEDLLENDDTAAKMIEMSLPSNQGRPNGSSGNTDTGTDYSNYLANQGLGPNTGKTIKITGGQGENSDGCTKLNFSILKVYYIILLIISLVNMLLNIIFTILELVTQIIAFAGTCWNDPPAIARIVELIVNKVISLVMMILNQLLQLMWDSMNLQCLSDAAKETLKQIRSLQTGFVGFMQGFDRNKFAFSKLIEEASDVVGDGSEGTTDTGSDSDDSGSEDPALAKAEQENSAAKAASDARNRLEGGNGVEGDTVTAITEITPPNSNTPPEGKDTSNNDSDTK